MKTLLWSTKATFKDAIKLLDENGTGFLALVDEDGLLKGILTDGDVRRAILSDQTSLEKIVNLKPEVAIEGTPKKTIINKLKKIHRKHMPVVNSVGRLKGVIALDDEEFNLKPNWVVIMAGGLGTRLGDLTKDTPKPMLELGGKPMIEHIIDMFVADGFTKFMISVNYKSEVIKDYFKDGAHLGIEIMYLEEQKRLGTGGALSLIDIELNEPFFVTNGDVLTTISYNNILEFHSNVKSTATMCIKEEGYQIPYGVIEVDDEKNIVSMVEKPTKTFFINTGVYVLDPSVLNFVPKDEYFDLPSLFEKVKQVGATTKSFEITDYWVDVGRPSDFVNVSNKFSFF
ncbi:MAG: nucleotidyltransferase family protein [Methyloprofundus sp.]|nr:nucleotidyltransferase family protein [Methyloprofundus sp.]